MADPTGDSFSSSENEEELARLKEAIDTSIQNDEAYTPSYTLSKLKQSTHNGIAKLASNRSVDGIQTSRSPQDHLPMNDRPDKDIVEDDEMMHVLNITPGFRKHVARKLSESLDSDLTFTCEGLATRASNSNGSQSEDVGILLLGTSNSYLTSEDATPEKSMPVKHKRKVSSSSDSSDEDARLAEATVSHDFIVQQSSVPYFTSSQPADFVVNMPGDMKDKRKNVGSSNHSTADTASAKESNMDRNTRITGVLPVVSDIGNNCVEVDHSTKCNNDKSFSNFNSSDAPNVNIVSRSGPKLSCFQISKVNKDGVGKGKSSDNLKTDRSSHHKKKKHKKKHKE